MSYLLDTNVVSELRKREAPAHVTDWARRAAVTELYVSVVTIIEIEIGVAQVERCDPAQGAVLRQWLESGVKAGFADRVLSIGTDVAICAARLHVPDRRPERDAYIAATAVVNGLTVVTRNVRDFAATGVPVLNPWTA